VWERCCSCAYPWRRARRRTPGRGVLACPRASGCEGRSMTRSIAGRASDWRSILRGISRPLRAAKLHAHVLSRARSLPCEDPGVVGRADPQHARRIRRDVSRNEEQEWFFHLDGPVHEVVRQRLASSLEVDSLKYLARLPTFSSLLLSSLELSETKVYEP